MIQAFYMVAILAPARNAAAEVSHLIQVGTSLICPAAESSLHVADPSKKFVFPMSTTRLAHGGMPRHELCRDDSGLYCVG